MKHRTPFFLAAGVVALASALALLSLIGVYDPAPVAAFPPSCSHARFQPPQAAEGLRADPATAAYAALVAPAETGAGPRRSLAKLRSELASELELGGELARNLDEYAPAGIRRLRRTGHGSNPVSYYYIPGKRTSLLSATCLRKLPTAEQQVVRAYARRFPPGPAYCLVGTTSQEAFPLACGTLGAPLAGYAFGLARTTRNELVGLVPDGVAAVRIFYQGGVVTAGAVSHNLFIAAAPKPATRMLPCEIAAVRKPTSCTQQELLGRVRTATPLAVSWLDPTGTTLRRFTLTASYLHDAEETDGQTEPFLGL